MDINTIFEWIKWLGIWVIAGALAVATLILIIWALTHFMWKRPAAKKAAAKTATNSTERTKTEKLVHSDPPAQETAIHAVIKPGQSAGIRPIAGYPEEDKAADQKADASPKVDSAKDEAKKSDHTTSTKRKFLGIQINRTTISLACILIGVLAVLVWKDKIKLNQLILPAMLVISLMTAIYVIRKIAKLLQEVIRNIVRFAGISVFTLALMATLAGAIWILATMVPGIVITNWMVYTYVAAWIALYFRTFKYKSEDYVKPGHIGVPRLWGWTVPLEKGPGPYFWFGTMTETPDVAMVANLFGHYKDGSDSNGMEVTVGGPSVIAGVKDDDAVAGLKDSKIIALLKAAVSWHIVDHHKAQRVLGIKDWENFEWNEEVENNLFKKILPQILTHIRAVVASYPFDKIVAENSEAVRRVNDTTKVDPSEEKSSLYLVNEFAKENFGIEILKISFTKILAKDQAITDLMAGPSVEEMQRAKEKADAETATKLIETVMNRLGYRDKTFAQLTQFQQVQVLDMAGKSKGEAGGKSEGITGAALIAAAEALGKGVAGILGGGRR